MAQNPNSDLSAVKLAAKCFVAMPTERTLVALERALQEHRKEQSAPQTRRTLSPVRAANERN
jgi:hypothetical protein